MDIKKYLIKLIFVLFFILFLSSVELNQALPLINRNEEEFIHYLQVAQRNRSQGNYEKALLYFNQALDLARKVKLKDEILEALGGKGIVLWNLGRMEEAADCFRQGLQLARDWDFRLAAPFFQTGLEISHLYQEGKSRRQKMDYAGSLASFERAIVLARKIRCPELELKCLRQASLVFYDQNELEKYRAFNEKGLRMARLLSHSLEEGRFLNNLGLYYLEKRDLLASFNILNKASLLLEAEGTKGDVADNLYNLGLAISFLGFYDRAIKYFRRAMEIDKELGKMEAYIFDLNNIGLCLLNKGRINHDLTPVREAITYFREALHLSEENKLIKRKIMVLNNLANALFLLGERDEALSCVKTGLELSKETNDIYQLIVINDTLGSFFTQSDPEKALKYLFQALHLSLKSPAYKDEWTLYYNIGRSYESLKAYDLAIEFYNKSIDLIEFLRKKIDYDFYQVGFLRNKQEVFDALIRVKKKIYDEQNNLACKEDLFNCLERTKAKSFLYTLNNPSLKPGNLTDESANKSMELQEIYDLSSRIESLKKQGETQFDLLRREDLSLTLAAERRREAPDENPIEEKRTGLKEIQAKLLDEDTAILEYYLADWGSLAIIITKKDFQITDLPSRKNIEDSVIGYAKLISNPPVKNLSGEETARRIYREIFKPLEDRFSPGLKNLIIIPDGLLYCLPFEALMKDEGNKSEYLVERYNIVYAPSISAFNILMGRIDQLEKEDKDILAIGYPQYKLFFKEKKKQKNIDLKRVSPNMVLQNNLQISTLPYTKKEIKTIASLFPQEKRDIYLAEKASEGLVKNLPLDNYKIIHFACHGYLDEGFPFRSALILTPEPEKGEDGFLQVHEISELKLRARLVVLSACQSALGSLEKAEGILSLNRVFFTCGARAVISSLWKVNDRASSDLMGHFYRQLKQGVSIAGALRAAKMKMLTSRLNIPFTGLAMFSAEMAFPFFLTGNNFKGR